MTRFYFIIIQLIQPHLKYGIMIKNKNIEQTWKLEQRENWNQTFRHKSKDAPTLGNGSKVCLKFHVKGFCFQDCKFKGLNTQLTGQDFEVPDKYIKWLRA